MPVETREELARFDAYLERGGQGEVGTAEWVKRQDERVQAAAGCLFSEATLNSEPTGAAGGNPGIAVAVGRLMANSMQRSEEAFVEHLRDHVGIGKSAFDDGCRWCLEAMAQRRWRVRLRKWVSARVPRMHLGPCR